MLIILRFRNGDSIQALLLAASRCRMRVVIPGSNDALDVQLRKNAWNFEDGRVADVEAMIAGGYPLPPVFIAAHIPHAA